MPVTTTTGVAARLGALAATRVALYSTTSADESSHASSAAAASSLATQFQAARDEQRSFETPLAAHASRESLLYDTAPLAPPTTWGEHAWRLAHVVRLSWSEALARLGVWRLDHVLAIRLLSQRDVNADVARAVSSAGTRVVLDDGSGVGAHTWSMTLEEIKRALVYSKSLRRAPDLATVARQGGVSLEEILLSDLAPKMMRPAYVLFRDERSKRLVFVIRGTHSAKDMITNLTGSVCPHHFMVNDEVKVGYAHSGFLTTARYLQRTMRDELRKALDENRGYELQIVGHSLGGGVAVLLTEMLRQEPEFAAAGLHCYTFACPSTLSRELAESCQPFVTTCVNNADIVPFVSFSKIAELQSEVVRTALEQQFLRKWRASKAAMTSSQGPTPSRFAAAAAAVDQCYGPQKYPPWLRAMQTLKNRHDNLLEKSSLYRKSLLLGKRVSKTSSRLASLSGAFIAGIVAPRVRSAGSDAEGKVGKENVEDEVTAPATPTKFAKTKQQVGDFMSASVFAKDIDSELHQIKRSRTGEESDEASEFEEYIEKARTALEHDFEKPLTKDDLAKIEKVEGAAAQEVLAMQEDVGVFCAAELLSDEKSEDIAESMDHLPTPHMDASPCLDPADAEREPVIKRDEKPGEAEREAEKRGRVLLYPAGRMLHFVHNIASEPSPIFPPSSAKFVAYADVNLDVYRRIILSRTMIADHFLAKYEDVINAVLTESPPNATSKP